ncbi:hypothetical protein BDQ12DRAFT_599545 [Crucibulum laeve]|uniref:RING-type E3 ubiquitin transferase n=1 Tax=Crucibulum laeve TaxID=68775 RepID=A0A5C3MCG6_9AGAR|nr:hypothetical protein BDQ12DRAFT_599545 [Crucibulum laeve]
MFSVARTSSSRSSVTEDNFVPRQDRRIERHHRPPRYPEVCGLWLNGRCTKEYQCRFVHEDLDYDDPMKPPSVHRPAPRPPEVFLTTIHDHIKVRFGEGFEVQNIVTGFETPWIFIANVPVRVTEADITKLVKPFGQIVDIRLPTSKSDAPAMLVKVRMSTPLEASQARTALHGSKSFGAKISVRLGLNNSTGGAAMLRDNAVRIEWEAPGKIAYGGYSTLEDAQRAIAATRVPVGDHFVRGTIHSGLPVVGVVTVRFRTLPLDVDETAMEMLANPEDVMWERPNYTSLPRAISGIKRTLEEGAELLEFDILPPPYRDSKIRAWAHFASPADAKAARDRLSGRKPAFTGLTPVYARHVKTITYSLNLEKFGKVASDLYALRDSVGGRGQNSSNSISIIPRQAQGYVLVKLCGEELKELGQLKAELERLLTGEVIRKDGKVIWDNFFSQTAGIIFLEDLQRAHPRITIQKDVTRRMIRLFGPSDLRAVVRQEIIRKATQLLTQKVHVISLDGRLIGLFMSPDLMKLQQDLGPENVILDLWNRVLKIRGDSLAFDIAKDIVNKARQRHRGERSSQENGCPVCFDAPSLPVTLHCGHSWCRACLEGYFNAAIDQKFFPLTCLGDEARCSERIPLETARQVLPLNGFDAVVEAAFSAHIHTHPDEFHFCPSPDCPQVYRATADAAVLQCPSCLVRICTGCHSEEHVGLACAEADGGDGLFKEWMKEHDVKNCPSCQVPIERAEGCNHMTCTRCQTHICWVCMETFPGGEGIYGHMRSEHGSFGLGPIE